MKKVWAVLLAAALLLALTLPAMADGGYNPPPAKTHTTEDGTMTISESGTLFSYSGAGGTVVIPNEVTSISYDVFQGCTDLTSVTIPDGVTTIGDYAFAGCTSLTSVSIPDSVRYVGEHSFDSTPWLDSLGDVAIANHVLLRYRHPQGETWVENVVIPKGVTVIADGACDRYETKSAFASVSIPEGVTYIGKNAFQGQSSLEQVSVPSSLKKIGEDAFSYTPWLQSLGDCAIVNHILVKYQGDESDVVIPKGVTSIGDSAFSSCDSLQSVTIPDSVTSIGDYAFSYCHSLQSVTIPGSVTSIGAYAFEGNPLTSVTIPGSVKSIGDGAFSLCRSLQSVTIKEGVEHIGNGMFYDAGIKSITIPLSVKRIGDHAMYDGPVQDVYYGGSSEDWEKISFADDSHGGLDNSIDAPLFHYNSDGPKDPVVQRSPQKLSVNGELKDVEKYNIDGENYFKLRDIAYLLNGTSAQFAVYWNADSNSVGIYSGRSYEANGSELVIGADRSATAVRSPQTIEINYYSPRISVFNLGGNNFFKLRDLGEALGFQVDYDEATNTAVVTTD